MSAVVHSAETCSDRLPVWRQVLGVFKLRIGFLIMLTALAGLASTRGPWPEGWRVTVLALAVLVAAAAAGAFNQLFEADADRLMARTRGRAFASGALTPGPWWLAGITGLLALAVCAAWQVTNGIAALYLFLGAFTYAVIYTVGLKRRTWLNIVVGGLAGSFAVLTGAAAVEPAPSAQPCFWLSSCFCGRPTSGHSPSPTVMTT